MQKVQRTKLKNLTRKVKNKKGATLVELLAVVCILGIVATLSFSAVFSAGVQVKKLSEISSAQKTSALVQYYIMVYGKAADRVQTFTGTIAYSEYNLVSKVGFQDYEKENEANPEVHKYNDMFFRINDQGQFSISRFSMADEDKEGISYGTKTLLTLDGIESIEFSTKSIGDTGIGKTGRYLLSYQVVTASGYVLDGGVVMNNVKSGFGVDDFMLSAENNNTLNIRTASRAKIDRD